MYRFNLVFQPLFAENRPMLAFRALGDVTIVTTMSTLVGLELWTDQIGPQTTSTEQVDGMEGAVGFDSMPARHRPHHSGYIRYIGKTR